MAKAVVVPRGERGVGLVELMIAMGLSLLIGLAVIEVFLGQRQLYVAQDEQSRMQENARFLFEQNSHDLRMVGFWGCSNKVVLTNSTSDTSYDHLADNAVTVEDGVLYIKFLEPTSKRAVDVGGSADLDGYQDGVPALVSNCTRAELFMPEDPMPTGFAVGAEVFPLAAVNYALVGDKVQKTSVDLIDNVQALEFEFGTGVGDYVTDYETATEIGSDWSKVKSVKVTLTLTSKHAGKQEFKSLIAIRNRLP